MGIVTEPEWRKFFRFKVRNNGLIETTLKTYTFTKLANEIYDLDELYTIRAWVRVDFIPAINFKSHSWVTVYDTFFSSIRTQA